MNEIVKSILIPTIISLAGSFLYIDYRLKTERREKIYSNRFDAAKELWVKVEKSWKSLGFYKAQRAQERVGGSKSGVQAQAITGFLRDLQDMSDFFVNNSVLFSEELSKVFYDYYYTLSSSVIDEVFSLNEVHEAKESLKVALKKDSGINDF